ncbi:Ribonucleotide reductase, alpha subunit [Candidatus Magnetomoraceae bacterium gMMP-15]
MPKCLELRKVINILKQYGIIYVTGKGRHPKFYDPEIKKSYPVKSHGKKTIILRYALNDMINKFGLPADVFDNK